MLPLDGVEKSGSGVEIQCVAELVRFRRARRFDACRLFSCVVPAVAALAERPEQIAKSPIPQEIKRLVRDLERHRRLVGALPAAATAATLTFGVEVRRRRDVAFLAHSLDDLLNELFELRTDTFLIAIRWVAEQPLNRLFRQHSAI